VEAEGLLRRNIEILLLQVASIGVIFFPYWDKDSLMRIGYSGEASGFAIAEAERKLRSWVVPLEALTCEGGWEAGVGSSVLFGEIGFGRRPRGFAESGVKSSWKGFLVRAYNF